jgi:hypothetical protein
VKKILLLSTLFATMLCHGQTSEISIISNQPLLENSISGTTIKDVQQLLQQACHCTVSLNNAEAPVQLVLPRFAADMVSPPGHFQKEATVPYYPFPVHDYKWSSARQDGKIKLQLTADSWQGVSFGLYGLLQEQLGFSFYHPRETIIPDLNKWPLQDNLAFEGKALFDKKGFHLHTQHPLELTEPLHNPELPNAIGEVKQYIDWLVRNGQTYFEFCLLESVDHDKWPPHAKAMVDYCHQRGIMAAVDVSLHMIQQKTFQLYKKSAHKEKQVVKSLQWLLQSDWDIINMEFATAEFIGGNQAKREALRLFIVDWMDKNAHTKLMGRKHVVRDETEVMSKKKKIAEPDSAAIALDKKRGILIHTVMCYDMTEAKAPVYENENQRHMFSLLLKEMKQRETWYYPESAYWVTFDNSVPMLLLPYLSARLSDIDTCVKYNVPGHITFSSGWEWGYWLTDWSIARWSWQYSVNGTPVARTATDGIEKIFGDATVTNQIKSQLALQQTYLKDKELLRWLAASTVTDELPFGFNKAFQPRPHDLYKAIRRKIPMERVNEYRQTALPDLKAFADSTLDILNTFEQSTKGADSPRTALLNELTAGLRMTALRARHKYRTLEYLLEVRAAKLEHRKYKAVALLDSAIAIRNGAMPIVLNRETQYRYPLDRIAREMKSYTSYDFGYLYTVSKLHFWEREEEQARHNKYGFTYRNIYDVFKIIGLKD